jgi:hypothetical protein
VSSSLFYIIREVELLYFPPFAAMAHGSRWTETVADGRFESRDTTGDGVIDNQVGASATAASSSWSAADAVHLRDLLFDDEVMDMVKEAGTQLQTLLNAAKRRNLISWSGALEMTDALPAGPELVANEGATVSEERPTEQLCEALQSGEHLTELLKLLSPQFTRLKSASTGLKSGVSAALADSSVSLVRTVVDNLIDQGEQQPTSLCVSSIWLPR